MTTPQGHQIQLNVPFNCCEFSLKVGEQEILFPAQSLEGPQPVPRVTQLAPTAANTNSLSGDENNSPATNAAGRPRRAAAAGVIAAVRSAGAHVEEEAGASGRGEKRPASSKPHVGGAGKRSRFNEEVGPGPACSLIDSRTQCATIAASPPL